MANTRRLFFLIFLISMLAIGCGKSGDGASSSSIGSFSPFGSSSSKKITDVNIYVGTQGLTAEFVKGAPPPKVFESSSFPILLKIRNNGAYSIKGRQEPHLSGLMVIGNEKDYIRIVSVEKNTRAKSGATQNGIWFDLEGKTQTNLKGNEIVVAVNAQTGKLDPQSENKPSTLTATLCYPYKTTLSTTVCIDPDVAGIRPGKKVCAVKDISFGGGQGAPIAVTKIESQMIPIADKDIIKPQFLIFVENKGNGNPVNIIGYYTACKEIDFNSKETWNAATLRAYTSGKEGENQLVCCPNKEGQCPEDAVGDMAGFIRFRDRKDYVKCTFRNGQPRDYDAFTSPLRIEIDYGYVQTTTANFMIQKPLRY